MKYISVPCGNCNKEFKKLESECAYQCYKCYKKLSTVLEDRILFYKLNKLIK